MATHEAPPSADEIIEAVRRFLYEAIGPSLDPYRGFQCRVAVSLLGVLRRELTERATASERQRARLLEILGAAEGGEAEVEALSRRLARGLRSGEVDFEDPTVAAHVRLTQEENTAISNPKWAAALKTG